MKKIFLILIIFSFFFGQISANGLGFLGCCGGPGPGPYPGGMMTPSGYPIYGMAPQASAAVANSYPGDVYSYGGSSGGGGYGGSSGYGSSGYGSGGYGSSGYGSNGGYGSSGGGYGGGSYGGSTSGGGGSSGIDFDSIPYGNLPPGSSSNIQPIAIRYFSQPIPVNIDPSSLRPLGQTQLMRIPIYGRIRSSYQQPSYQQQSQSQSQGGYSHNNNNYQSTPNLYRPNYDMGGNDSPSKYNKFDHHSVDSNIAQGYQPAYSNWNKQPMQAVFRQSNGGGGGPSSSSSGSSSSGYSENSGGGGGGSQNIPSQVHPSSSSSSSGSSSSMGDASHFPDVSESEASPPSFSSSKSSGGGGDGDSDAFSAFASEPSKAGSFKTSEASIPTTNHFRARAAAARSTATSEHASELKPVSILQRRSTGAENYELTGDAKEAIDAMLLEREKIMKP